jgi:hypothetical protein
VLSRSQRQLLRKAVEDYAPGLLPLTLGDVVNLPVSERNRLRSALGELLSVVGFDSEWNITPVGGEIEHLIDVLGPK